MEEWGPSRAAPHPRRATPPTTNAGSEPPGRSSLAATADFQNRASDFSHLLAEQTSQFPGALTREKGDGEQCPKVGVLNYGGRSEIAFRESVNSDAKKKKKIALLFSVSNLKLAFPSARDVSNKPQESKNAYDFITNGDPL